MDSITGRDGYIIAKAIRWALKYAETMPDDMREWGDEADMKAILEANYSMPNKVIEATENVTAAIAKEVAEHPEDSSDAIMKRIAEKLESGAISGVIHRG